jgi:hypothetical protein
MAFARSNRGAPTATRSAPQFRHSMPTGKSYCVLHAKQAAGNAKLHGVEKRTVAAGWAAYFPQISPPLI